MAGNHRATRAAHGHPVSGRAAALAAAVVMIPLLWFAADRAFDDSGTPVDRGALGPLPTGTPTPTPATTPVSESTAEPTSGPSTTAPAASLPRIAPAAPRRLVSGTFLDVGFDSSSEPRADGSFRAASTAEITRWGTRGQPGSPGTDTVYVIGKTYARGSSAFAALPKVKVGSRVSIRTDRGVLTYTVTSSTERGTVGIARNKTLAARVPGRLVLIGLRHDTAGDATGQALVLVARLTGARTD